MKINPLICLPAASLLGMAGSLPAEPSSIRQAASVDGLTVFKQRCAMCHHVEAGKTSPLGPNLAGIVRRPAATATDYRYSPALKASGLTWTRENLDAYVAAPTKLVPGTRMVTGVPDARQRAAVVDYLMSAPAATSAPTPGKADHHAGH